MRSAFYKPRLVTGVIFSLLFFCPLAIYAFEEVPIIPRCKSLEPQEGFYPLQQQIRISITGGTSLEDQLKANAERFAVFLRKGAGLKVAVGGEGKAGESEIKLRVAPDMFENKVAGAYRLSVDQKAFASSARMRKVCSMACSR